MGVETPQSSRVACDRPLTAANEACGRTGAAAISVALIPPRPRLPRKLRTALALTLIALLAAPLAFAHMSGVDHLRLELVRSHIHGQWDVHLHDARLAVGLDPLIGNDTGFVEMQTHEAAFRETLLAHVHLAADGRPVPL